MNTGPFTEALRRGRPLLLDGGLATELEARGADISGMLWSAKLLATDPRAIVGASLAFLEAGADCVSSASYQASREGFAAQGIDAAGADRLMRLSIELACQARDEFLAGTAAGRSRPLVAASIGPYGAARHDGSEYTGDYAISGDGLRRFHEPRLALFDDTAADVLALETIPSVGEAGVLAALLRSCRKPAWISFSCRDGAHISDGTPVEAVAALFAGHPVVQAVGVNCTPPQYVPELVGRLRVALPGVAIAAYPNSGESYDAAAGRWRGTVTPVDCGAAAREWVAAGASIVGGCCRMGPAHIAAMRAALGGTADRA